MPSIARTLMMGQRGSVLHVTSAQFNVNLRSLANSAGYSGSGPYTIIIESGVPVGSSSPSLAALVRGTWPVGIVPVLINKGIIAGCAGAGGRGTVQNASVGNGMGPGGGGGVGLDSSDGAMTVDNAAGTIAGGGGGGGGGGTVYDGTVPNGVPGSGGGGGRGTNGGPGGPGGDAYGRAGNAGTAGDSLSVGVGGAAINDGLGNISGVGGTGGALGTAGSAGAIGSSTNTWTIGPAGAGGPAGNSVTGNSNITWTATGTRTGTVS